MVWPPPKVTAGAEGEVTVERPHGGAPDVSAVVPGVQPMRSAGPVTSPAPAMPGATVSVMAATATPRDWLERPEGLIGCVLGSRYRITSLLGRGPMGIACEGESSRGRQVTLKLLPRAPDLPVEHFAWQVRQALALAHFDHPNVAPISDFGPLDDGSSFVSRARVPGVTLRTILRQGGLPIGRALDITRQVTAALVTAHAQDITHGRLKPENIIVQGGARGSDMVKVVDFGMAGLNVNLRAVAPNENEQRRLALRTRMYLPGEVLGGAAIDVYSLGVMLFEMIAGQPPIAIESLPASGPQPAPLSFAQCNPALSVPASVNELVQALLNPRASEHGLDAVRLGQMLDALLGRPSIAPPEPVTAQIQSALPPAVSLREPQPPARMPPPDVHAFTAPSAASLVWPSSPPPASGHQHSYPPLPPAFSGSTFPPAPSSFGQQQPQRASSYPPLPQPAHAQREPRGVTPSLPPVATAVGSYPPPVSTRQAAPVVDAPFGTPSFPPPAALPTGIAIGKSDDVELDLRPSFIGRLKRLFGKKPPADF
jgi:serine/threonine protein kinase